MTFEEINRHINVSRETYEKLYCYVDLVTRWQAKLNLISVKTLPDIWHRHVLDSLQLISHLTDPVNALYDIGSGAGFPAIPIAIASHSTCSMVESDQRKAIFLSEATRKLELKAHVISERAESLSGVNADIITARACAPLTQLCAWSAPLLSTGGKCLFLKGRQYRNEIEGALVIWDFHYDVSPSITDPEAAIVTISQLRKRSDLCVS